MGARSAGLQRPERATDPALGTIPRPDTSGLVVPRDANTPQPGMTPLSLAAGAGQMGGHLRGFRAHDLDGRSREASDMKRRRPHKIPRPAARLRPAQEGAVRFRSKTVRPAVRPSRCCSGLVRPVASGLRAGAGGWWCVAMRAGLVEARNRLDAVGAAASSGAHSRPSKLTDVTGRGAATMVEKRRHSAGPPFDVQAGRFIPSLGIDLQASRQNCSRRSTGWRAATVERPVARPRSYVTLKERRAVANPGKTAREYTLIDNRRPNGGGASPHAAGRPRTLLLLGRPAGAPRALSAKLAACCWPTSPRSPASLRGPPVWVRPSGRWNLNPDQQRPKSGCRRRDGGRRPQEARHPLDAQQKLFVARVRGHRSQVAGQALSQETQRGARRRSGPDVMYSAT